MPPPRTLKAGRRQFYKNLYVGDSIKNPRKIKRKLNTNAGLVGVYVITLCNGPDQLEIYSSAVLMQPFYRHAPLYVIGIAGSYEEAVAIVEKIAIQSYEQNGDCDLKKYLLDEDRLHVK